MADHQSRVRPLVLTASALTGRIYAGYANRDGTFFQGKKTDVTGLALNAVVGHVGHGNSVTLSCHDLQGKAVPVAHISVEEGHLPSLLDIYREAYAEARQNIDRLQARLATCTLAADPQ
ncbi:hypothetical protein Z042_07700 [Chania multitudinisentens RB-25]|uniref:Uncharacterized protein n=1 Tax=Chania multitudinisentens RB-25 TaxID=1441930 RepID=W0LG47_9GAMM|nr:hypothetical protein [Chania multitudinisentens]AHG22711.1 hypothetical protein Z042_07700 [Chania multitudinisentens RB-25]